MTHSDFLAAMGFVRAVNELLCWAPRHICPPMRGRHAVYAKTAARVKAGASATAAAKADPTPTAEAGRMAN